MNRPNITLCLQPRGRTKRAIVRAICVGPKRGQVVPGYKASIRIEGMPSRFLPYGTEHIDTQALTSDEALDKAYKAVIDPDAILLVYRGQSEKRPYIPNQFEGPGRYQGYFCCRWNADLGMFVQLDGTVDEAGNYTFENRNLGLLVQTR